MWGEVYIRLDTHEGDHERLTFVRGMDHRQLRGRCGPGSADDGLHQGERTRHPHLEWFGDEKTGRVLWYQEYRDDEAFLTHAQNLAEQDFREEIFQVLALDRVVLLTPANHPTVKEMARQPGFVKLQDIARVVR